MNERLDGDVEEKRDALNESMMAFLISVDWGWFAVRNIFWGKFSRSCGHIIVRESDGLLWPQNPGSANVVCGRVTSSGPEFRSPKGITYISNDASNLASAWSPTTCLQIAVSGSAWSPGGDCPQLHLADLCPQERLQRGVANKSPSESRVACDLIPGAGVMHGFHLRAETSVHSLR
jgi:hypothetical protein